MNKAPTAKKNYTVFDTIQMLIDKGMSFDEAVKEAEGTLHTKIPDDLKDRIREQSRY